MQCYSKCVSVIGSKPNTLQYTQAPLNHENEKSVIILSIATVYIIDYTNRVANGMQHTSYSAYLTHHIL